MFNTLKHDSTRKALLAATLFATATSAFAQAPSEAQKSAIRSHAAPTSSRTARASRRAASPRVNVCRRTCRACRRAARPRSRGRAGRRAEDRSCAGQIRTEPKLNQQSRSRAKAEPAPAQSLRQKPRRKLRAPRPSSRAAPRSAAIKSACRADYPKVCASVPPGGAPALECLEKNKAKVSAACAKAVTPRPVVALQRCGAPQRRLHRLRRQPRRRPRRAVIVLRPMRPREELFILRSACGGDVRSLCAGVAARWRPYRAMHCQQCRVACLRARPDARTLAPLRGIP